jgi:hypothetical protein
LVVALVALALGLVVDVVDLPGVAWAGMAQRTGRKYSWAVVPSVVSALCEFLIPGRLITTS